MDTPTCETCIHFVQHFYLDDQYCGALNCGHCGHRRIKHRKPCAPACGHYAPRTSPPKLPDRDGVVHFLTTRLLEHILTLSLPPRIRDAARPEYGTQQRMRDSSKLG